VPSEELANGENSLKAVFFYHFCVGFYYFVRVILCRLL
jgi:hypothetical protein